MFGHFHHVTSRFLKSNVVSLHFLGCQPFVARIWIFSIESLLFLRVGAHTDCTYSKCGRMKAQNNFWRRYGRQTSCPNRLLHQDPFHRIHVLVQYLLIDTYVCILCFQIYLSTTRDVYPIFPISPTTSAVNEYQIVCWFNASLFEVMMRNNFLSSANKNPSDVRFLRMSLM